MELTRPGKEHNEHEGLAKTDIDGDHAEDIVGEGMWFKYLGSDKFFSFLKFRLKSKLS